MIHSSEKDILGRKLNTLVENRTSFSMDRAEMNIYETFQPSEMVALQFSSPVLASMIQGRKVMHLKDRAAFEFFPKESIILPSNELMQIDFPDANAEHPTRCLALAIAPEQIKETLQQLNEQYPKAEQHEEWRLNEKSFHFTQDEAINDTLRRLMYLIKEDHMAKHIFSKNVLVELIIRLLQTQARSLLLDQSPQHKNSHRFAYIADYIKQHCHLNLSVAQLAEKACMSKVHFFRCFKNEFGITPVEFINRERIKAAKKLLATAGLNVSDACFSAGFNSLSHFIQVFKKHETMTPSQYQQIITS